MIDLMSTVGPEWLAVLLMTALGVLAVGGYVGLWKLTAWLDERADRRHAVAMATAAARERRQEGRTRYTARVTGPGAIWPGHHR